MLKMIVSNDDLKPVVGTEGSAGYDLKISHDVVLNIGESKNLLKKFRWWLEIGSKRLVPF